jgi:hypothetical protein
MAKNLGLVKIAVHRCRKIRLVPSRGSQTVPDQNSQKLELAEKCFKNGKAISHRTTWAPFPKATYEHPTYADIGFRLSIKFKRRYGGKSKIYLKTMVRLLFLASFTDLEVPSPSENSLGT